MLNLHRLLERVHVIAAMVLRCRIRRQRNASIWMNHAHLFQMDILVPQIQIILNSGVLDHYRPGINVPQLQTMVNSLADAGFVHQWARNGGWDGDNLFKGTITKRIQAFDRLVHHEIFSLPLEVRQLYYQVLQTSHGARILLS